MLLKLLALLAEALSWPPATLSMLTVTATVMAATITRNNKQSLTYRGFLKKDIVSAGGGSRSTLRSPTLWSGRPSVFLDKPINIGFNIISPIRGAPSVLLESGMAR